jgi:hypothetical protein
VVPLSFLVLFIWIWMVPFWAKWSREEIDIAYERKRRECSDRWAISLPVDEWQSTDRALL